MDSCRKCGSNDFAIKPKGQHMGKYCKDCGAWIKWVGRDEIHQPPEMPKSTTDYNSIRDDILEVLNKHIASLVTPNMLDEGFKLRLRTFEGDKMIEIRCYDTPDIKERSIYGSDKVIWR